jgi:hypothetical protein
MGVVTPESALVKHELQDLVPTQGGGENQDHWRNHRQTKAGNGFGRGIGPPMAG